MTATDELRRLLDGRGIEYYRKAADETVFSTGTEHVHVQDDLIGGCLELFIRPVTPAQAVEATLGRGTCHECAGMEDVFECSECGMRYEGWALKRWARYCPNCGRRRVG